MFDGFLFLLFEYFCITQSTSLPHKIMQIPITSLGLIERGKDKTCVSLRKNQVLIASDVSINMILSHFNTIKMDLSVPSLQALLSPAKVRFVHTYSFTSCDAHLENHLGYFHSGRHALVHLERNRKIRCAIPSIEPISSYLILSITRYFPHTTFELFCL